MVNRFVNLKQKILKLSQLHYVWKTFRDFSLDNMKKTGLYGCVYEFSTDYDAIAIDKTLDIHKYLMEKNDVV